MIDTALDTRALATSASRSRGTTLLLRAEGAAAFIGAVSGYVVLNGDWHLFALLLLLPDLSMLGYRIDAEFGAALYNSAHTYLVPGALALGGWLAGVPLLFAVALIWVAHIALDRALGFGLKRPGSFSDTHLSTKAA